MICQSLHELVGNTPLLKLNNSNFSNNIYAKLEFMNPTGSVKDRAAKYVLDQLLENNEITRNTIIIESSSGNYGVALAAYCHKLGLKFICVIDPKICEINRMLIKYYRGNLIEVQKPDKNGGYLLERIKTVEQFCKQEDDIYWINQYENPYNYMAYYHSLGTEICNELDHIDYIFLGVSSCGTITGVSKKVKEIYPDSKIIAVDIEGSVIFSDKKKERSIPGIGSSKIPKNLESAIIDDYILVTEEETIQMCNSLIDSENFIAGGSSGSVCAGIIKYFNKKQNIKNKNVVTIFPDKGERYMGIIYS